MARKGPPQKAGAIGKTEVQKRHVGHPKSFSQLIAGASRQEWLDTADARRFHADAMNERTSRPLAGAAALLSTILSLGASGDINQGWTEVRSPHFTVYTNASEKEGRRIADQFEQIRGLFHAAMPTLRVDPAQPVLILAAKNEATMKALLPEEWEVKGHIHHAGMYQQGEDKHYVILRLDSEGANPYHALYHEYMHSLLHLNFTSVPLWLDEGLAEFYGNSRLGDKESRVGTIDEAHLYILRESKLLPIETLLAVDHSSPYYNEANRASVFYAESWALVHYLMMDEDARQHRLLKSFLESWDKGGNQVEAAQQAFGDLKRFGKVIEGYSRQTSFRVALIKNNQEAAEKTYSARSLTPGEVLALRGDCFSHRNQLMQAQPLLEQAVQLEPNLPLAHEALGYYKYRREEVSGAEKEMQKAVELGSRSFVAPYYRGMLLLREGTALDPERLQEAVKSLQQAIQLNPQFAAAYEGLAHAYASSPEMEKQAVQAAIQAVKLEPGIHAYAINLVYVLLNNDQTAEAETMAKRLLEKADSAEEARTARNLLQRIKDRERWAAERKAQEEAAAAAAKTTVVAAPVTAEEVTTSSSSAASRKPPVDPTKLMAVDGTVAQIDCSHKPEVTLVLSGGNRPLRFHAGDFHDVNVSGPDGQEVPRLDACEKWKGRKIRLWFLAVKGKTYLGEVTDIAFQ